MPGTTHRRAPTSVSNVQLTTHDPHDASMEVLTEGHQVFLMLGGEVITTMATRDIDNDYYGLYPDSSVTHIVVYS